MKWEGLNGYTGSKIKGESAMIIGVPKEIKGFENRVGLTPNGVEELINNGHKVLIEKGAGEGSSFVDEEYVNAGAEIKEGAKELWESSEMVIKVKEPLPEEFKYFRHDLILFTYLHLAAEPTLAKALQESGITAIAYETVTENNTLPLLTPMSEVAGRMATQLGAQFLEKTKGGQGVLLSGVPGVKRSNVTIIGGGVVGTNALKIAVGLGASVTVLDLNADRLRELDDTFGSQIQTLKSNPLNIAEAVKEADLLICAVLIPGAKAPTLVSEEVVKSMKAGSVIVDVAIDQGGIVETIDHTTTHDEPTYIKHGVVHYAVANIPGAVPKTSTIALTNVTTPYAIQIANKGLENCLKENPALKSGVNTMNGHVTYPAVAKELKSEFKDVNTLLNV